MGYHRRPPRSPRYAIIDERPFLPFRLPDKPPTHPKNPPFPRDMIKALENFDFTNITCKSITNLTKLFLDYRKKDHPHPHIWMGQFGIVNYGLAPEALAPGSLNPENAAAPRDASFRDLLKNLSFINAKDKSPAPRLALAVGRLTAQNFNPDHVSQSHWIVFLDQTRLLWACYAYGIDNDDIELDEKGNPGPYFAVSDSAFGVDREHGQKVVFLGALDDVKFRKREELKSVKVHDLDWSTTSLSEEQKLAMSKADVEMKDSDTKSDAEMKDSGIKEENAEMKEFGTREPVETKNMALRPVPSAEVPGAVLDALQGAGLAAADGSA